MRHVVRRPRGRVGRAIAGSLAIHVLFVVVVAVPLRPGAGFGPAVRGIDTRASGPAVRLDTDELRVLTPVGSPGPVEVPIGSPTRQPPAGAVPEPSASWPAPPVVQRRPHRLASYTLPAEVRELLRKSSTCRSPAEEVRAVAPSSVVAPSVAPSSVVAPSVAPSSVVAPLHGPLGNGQTVAYVLDCSGSMGEFGRFAAARAALLATLQQQPETVKFRVVAYNTTARPVVSERPVAVTREAVAAVEAELGRLRPTGRSDHAAGLRLALTPRPDVIVLLSDADELTASAVRPLVGGARAVPVFLVQVTPEGVQPVRELR
jgi:hypothetical protein